MSTSHFNYQNPFLTLILLLCNPKKTEKKPVPNFKFAVAFSYYGFSVFCGTFSVFFGLNFDKKFQPFKNYVNNEVLGAKNCLITHLMPTKPCKCLIQAIITNKNYLLRTR